MDHVGFFPTAQAQFLKQLQNGSGDDQHVEFVQNFAKTFRILVKKNRGSSQTCPRGIPVPDDEDEEEDWPLHDRELGSCWGEGHLAQGGCNDGVDVGFDVDAHAYLIFVTDTTDMSV